MPQDLRQLIKDMSPGSLRLYKQQIAALTGIEKEKAFSRLSGIPELSDIVGRPTPEAMLAPEPPRQVEPAQALQLQGDIPMWQQALSTAFAPFRWAEEHITRPFGAVVTSPWSPEITGTEGMGWLERERAEYKAWDAPWGVKGAVETLPWFALPSALGIAGKVAGIGAKLAAAGGAVGRLAPAAKGLAGAIKYSPLGLMEQATGAALRPVGRILAKAIGKTKVPVPSQVWGKLTKTERSVVARELGLAEGIGQKAWSRLGKKNQVAISEAIVNPEKVIARTPVQVAPKVIPKLTSKIRPEGFNEPQEVAIKKLTDLTKAAEMRTKATLALRKPEQAVRIGEYEKLVQRNINKGMPAEEALGRAEAALRGAYPQAEVDAVLKTIRQGLTETDVNTLFGILVEGQYKSGFDRVNTFTALQDLLLNNVLQRNQIARLEDTFGSGLAKELIRKIGLGKRAGELAIDLANAPRALLASADISGLLRQGAILFARHPIEGVKTVKPMLQALFSDRNMVTIDSIIRSRVGMDDLLDAGLDITALPTQIAARITQREEAFASSIMNKIPFIKASNRAYVTVLNDMRSRSALNVLNMWKKAGIKYGKQDLTDLTRLVNWASGRGTLPSGMARQGGLMSALFFSPKLIASRLELPTTVLPAVTKSALVRKEAWRTLLSFVGVGAGILTMAKLSGSSDIELDPRSADFGKIKVDETRLDIWSGYTQYIRFLAQLSAATRKTSGGRMQTLNRGEVISRFARSKLSPATGLIADLLQGETYLGEVLPPKSSKGVWGQIYQRMMPLAIQDMIDAIQQDGITGGIVSSAGLLGVGVVTYTDEIKRARNKEAEEKYGMSWEEVGQRYGRAEQLKLEQASPKIVEAEKEQEERFATGTPSIMQQWHNEGKGVEDTYREAIDLATKELRATGDGRRFRDKVDQAAYFRRQAYSSRTKRTEYQEIVEYYNQPIDPKRAAEMNPGDIARREYYQLMFSPDMYDEFGNYRFDVADQREQEFLNKYGQQALDYIEEYRGSRWLDKPPELQALEQARDTLRPYWQIADQIWSMYPNGLKEISDQILIMERTDPERARQMLRRYPQILRARELIARYRKQFRTTNPLIDQAHRMYY